MRIVSPFFLILFTAAAVTFADPRPFTFTYDTYPVGKGNFEYEQWVTYKTHTREEAGFTRFDFRHELEMGITDNFDLSIYLPNWRYEDSEEHVGAQFDSVGVEGIVYLMNPVTDPFGLGLYLEVTVGDDHVEFEPKLLLQKDVGNWTLAYNLILETEIDGAFTGDEDELEGVIGHALGASYGLSPAWRIGGEVVIESEFEDWKHYEATTVYAGPTISYQGGTVPGTKLGWWVTVTPAVQLTREDDEPDFLARVIGGIEF